MRGENYKKKKEVLMVGVWGNILFIGRSVNIYNILIFYGYCNRKFNGLK